MNKNHFYVPLKLTPLPFRKEVTRLFKDRIRALLFRDPYILMGVSNGAFEHTKQLGQLGIGNLGPHIENPLKDTYPSIGCGQLPVKSHHQDQLHVSARVFLHLPRASILGKGGPLKEIPPLETILYLNQQLAPEKMMVRRQLFLSFGCVEAQAYFQGCLLVEGVYLF